MENPSLYKIIRNDIDGQLTQLQNKFDTDYTALHRAWNNARKWAMNGTREDEVPILIPYVGSGLNRLVAGGLGSWADLVKEVAKRCTELAKELGNEYNVKRSGLTMPQVLEIYLRDARGNDQKMGQIFEAFNVAFAGQDKPSAFHKRLVQMFPLLLTTNYNDLLFAASGPNNKKVFDLTEPECNPTLTEPSICHLHGRWTSGAERAELQSKIFAGVGRSNKASRPCLVITENQYHRIYSDLEYGKALTKIFAAPNAFLFLGASLANDEAGIHQILKSRRIEGGGFSGLYVGLDEDKVKEKLLELRGIHCINLPRKFGMSRHATEALFDALFDELEKRFGAEPLLLASPPTLAGPEVLCVGLSAWNRVFSLGSRKSIGTETSYSLDSQHVIEEPGGQHLWPALYLVNRGHQVALATTTGDDALGDEVKKRVTQYVERATSQNGMGDLIIWAWETKGSTRLTTVVTNGGTRLILDYDRDELPDLDAPRIDWEQWTSIKALYLGAYYLKFDDLLLTKLPNVRWSFFETGTKGPKKRSPFNDSVNIASRCTHVLSSSAFALRLAQKGGAGVDTLKYQRWLHDDVKGKKRIAKAAFERLWPNPSKGGTLLIVMGAFGSAVVTRNEIQHIPAHDVEKKRGRNWLGCGDIFRAEFIHQVLRGANSVKAAKAASKVVAERIQRMPFLPPPQIAS